MNILNKLCGGIKCVREHGVFYTIKYANRKIKKKFERTEIRKRGIEEYINYIERNNYLLRHPEENNNFVNITERPFVRSRNDTKLIAWYLPQYYQMDVNDKYHGKGFTEWTSVSRSIPLFVNHNQPRLPYDLGFYNLLNIDTMKRQAELANLYGIYGFCFDWYWFSGERTMEKPVELFLKNKDIDIHFCINWCTENWTALWDGESQDMIFEQKLQEGDDERIFSDLLPLFEDERYIKIDGKPVFMIYACRIFEKGRFVELINNLRRYVKKAGYPDLYVMLSTAGDFNDEVKSWGADALVEYPTINISACEHYELNGYCNSNAKSLLLLDMDKFIDEKRFVCQYKEKNVYRSAMVNFDNSPRKAYSNNCFITVNSTPLHYKKWLKENIMHTECNRERAENYVFVLSWNEWAESAALEPDLYWGYAYLQATKDALEEARKEIGKVDGEIILDEINEKKAKGVEKLVFYIHCIESMGDVIACEPIARYLKSIEPGSEIVWIVKEPAMEIVKYNPYIDKIKVVKCLSESMDYIEKLRKNNNSIIIDCHQNGRRCVVTDRYHWNNNNPQIDEFTYLNYGSLLANFCYSAGLPALDDTPKFYLNPELKLDIELPQKFIVIHCKSAESCKDWEYKKWEKLANDLNEKGISIVEIGLERIVKIKSDRYYDCTYIHDIQKIALILKRADAFIGIDSMFAHMANCFNIPSVLIFGKYKYFDRPTMYSGNFGHGKNVEILWAANNGLAAKVKVLDVELALDKVLKDNITK